MKHKLLRKKYIIWIIIGLIIIAVLGRRMGFLGKRNTINVATEKVEIRDITEFVAASGKIQPRVEVKISPDVSGEVVKIFVKEGDKVEKGDVLARIKPDTYQSNYDQMLATFDGQKANLANTKARLSQANAQLINSETAYNRSKRLFEQNVISQAEYDNAKASYLVAQAEVEAGKETVKAAEYSVKSTEAMLNEARNNLERTTIFAPMDGIVYSITVEIGERVAGASQFSAGTEIMRIADLNEMEVQVSINENDIIRVNIGDTSKIEVDAYTNRTFTGVITQISNATKSLAIASDQVMNYDVKIRIFPDSYLDLIDENRTYKFPFRPGMSASVEIITDKVSNAISVPIQAVTTREDTAKSETVKSSISSNRFKEVIFVYNQGIAEKRFVNTGIQDNYYIQVTDGLKENEEVIVSPYSAISRTLKGEENVRKVDKSQVFDN